ncbi:hypothetical protein MVEN_01965800 [Mycena venus]|uniref:F-box domain-containing protein n=1 Tax=Mycena venus TaxID=2733690 RepID=A0A8H6XH93_9AGAR|nr:hypothetical protein MVEN_01965800 [Mycena venus]
MRDFAQELVDKIIDECYTGPRGAVVMKTCGLVCSGWLPRSRLHLFARVTVDPNNLPLFIDVIASSSFPILSFIQHLGLHFVRRPLDNVLLSKIHCCPNLARIEVSIWENNTLGIKTFYRSLQIHLPFWASNSPSLTHFDFRGIDMHTPGIENEMILDIIQCVPTLEFLAISGMSMSMRPDSTPIDHSLPPLRNTLHLHGRGVGQFLRSLLLLPTPPTLTSLQLDMVCQSIEDVEHFLKHGGGELVSLSLTDLSSINAVPTVEQFIRHTLKLRNIELFMSNTSVILDILLVLPLYEWETITFVLYNYPTGIAWKDIDTGRKPDDMSNRHVVMTCS